MPRYREIIHLKHDHQIWTEYMSMPEQLKQILNSGPRMFRHPIVGKDHHFLSYKDVVASYFMITIPDNLAAAFGYRPRPWECLIFGLSDPRKFETRQDCEKWFFKMCKKRDKLAKRGQWPPKAPAVAEAEFLV